MNSVDQRRELEFLRWQADQDYQKIKQDHIEVASWMIPWRMGSLTGGKSLIDNRHIVDTTHILSQRSYVAGYQEGNTSPTRPWAKWLHADDSLNNIPRVKKWLDHFNDRVTKNIYSSNFYNAVPIMYYDYGALGTACQYVEERIGAYPHWFTLDPGSYRLINDSYGNAVILIREYQLTVKALVDAFGTKLPSGSPDWSNFSARVRALYERGDYTTMIDVVTVVKPNDMFDPAELPINDNRQWVDITWESSQQIGPNLRGYFDSYSESEIKYLRIKYSRRKLFHAPRSTSTLNFPYGLSSCGFDSRGAVQSLNKKAITKDVVLEKMANPAMMGPAGLSLSYRTTQSNKYIGLTPEQMNMGGLKQVMQLSGEGINALTADQNDLRKSVEKLWYADLLLYLATNPKTRTAEETREIVSEKNLVIGPTLQSLNYTYNVPTTDYWADWTIEMDPYLEPPPPELEGETLRTEFISVFAQAQKAADLPSIDRYVATMANLAGIFPQIRDKVNLDRYADLYENRLYLPEGLNRPQAEVEALRESNQAQAERMQLMTEALPAMAGAAADISKVERQV